MNRKIKIIFLSIIVLYTIVVYAGMLNNVPFNDDFSWMRNLYREGIFTSVGDQLDFSFNFTKKTHFFRPIPEILFSIMSAVFGSYALYYYIVSLVLHIINGLLVYVFINKLTESDAAALLAAFLFLIHPGINEAVYWISGIITLVFTLFSLIILIIFMDGIRKNNLSLRNTVFIVGLTVLALLTKETAITILPVLMLTWFFFKEKNSYKLNLKYLFLSLVAVIAVYMFIQYIVETRNYLVVDKIYQPGFHFFKNILVFHFVLLFPIQVNSVWSKAWIYLGPTLALTITGLIFGDRKIKYFVVWCWITLLPASFFNYHVYITSRYLYLASIGFCGIIAYVFFLFWNRLKTSKTGMVILLIPFVISVFCYSYKTFYNDLYFEAKAKKFEFIYDVIKERYPEIPDHTNIFLFGFPTLDVHMNAMMKVWDNPTLHVYTRLDYEKIHPGSIILAYRGTLIEDVTGMIVRDNREINFGTDATGLFIKKGFTRNVYSRDENLKFTWLRGDISVCQAPIWEQSRYNLKLKLKYVSPSEYQVGDLEVKVNNNSIGILRLAQGWDDYEIQVPRNVTKYGYNEMSMKLLNDSENSMVGDTANPIKIKHKTNVGIASLKFIHIRPVKGESAPAFPVKRPVRALPDENQQP